MSVTPPTLMTHQAVCVFADMAKSQAAAAAGQPAGKAVAIHPPRATDAFYAKLLPALEVPVCLQSMVSMCHMDFVQQVWRLLPCLCMCGCFSRRTQQSLFWKVLNKLPDSMTYLRFYSSCKCLCSQCQHLLMSLL